MRNSIFFLLLIVHQLSYAQCPAGDMIIQNQSQVNYFIEQCPDTDTIFGSLIIGDLNSDIDDISGLQMIKVVTGGISIQHNNNLQQLNGLDSIHSIGGWLTISTNKELTSIAHLEGITVVHGDISVSKNAELVNMDGLLNIRSLDGELLITENPKLTSLSGLSGISDTLENLRIHDNLVLSNLNGLDKIEMVVGDLTIKSNDSLLSLDGLEQLETIGGHCAISDNPSLVNLDAFANLTSIGADLYLGNNGSLSDCTGICGLLNAEGVVGSITVGDNLSSCLNNSVLLPYCQALPTFSLTAADLAIYPNPASQYLRINIDFAPKINRLQILTLSGRSLIDQGNKNKLIDITSLSKGMYILAVYTKDQVYYQKFVVD